MDTEHAHPKMVAASTVATLLYYLFTAFYSSQTRDRSSGPNAESMKRLIDTKSIDTEPFDLNLTARNEG